MEFQYFVGNLTASEVDLNLTAPLFYTFVKITIWTIPFPITIMSRNALLWLYKAISEKYIRSASMLKNVILIDKKGRWTCDFQKS